MLFQPHAHFVGSQTLGRSRTYSFLARLFYYFSYVLVVLVSPVAYIEV